MTDIIDNIDILQCRRLLVALINAMSGNMDRVKSAEICRELTKQLEAGNDGHAQKIVKTETVRKGRRKK